eukprot:CAMPEP_0196574296 /NCGR_PEP_ID=MMETSP1081-20130531/4046_1 /TAXON_ID=36882 /ORGANISM="Pyramimonas amylifera, Strain CCMP720" /LENGTH=292 /DNA_ID=CAMNT_0041892279 /DNA_START=277 /DNA_END=1155 /DNA_ORIENTATION=-
MRVRAEGAESSEHLHGFRIADFKSTGMIRRCTDKDIKKWNAETREERLHALESQLVTDLLRAVALFKHPVMTTALIAGDMVLLDIMHRQGLLQKLPVVFIDTLHLFPETDSFLQTVEKHYNFQTARYTAVDCSCKEDWNKVYASDLYLTNPGEYDDIAKVEPLLRALQDTKSDAWINGRRRDHGFDRANLPVYEKGSPVKVNPLAYWTFEDCWDYIRIHNVPYHPLHDQSFPSVGDVHSTRPVYDKKKWWEYGGERSGRFQGLNNDDGSPKTECGIYTFSENSLEIAATDDS